MLLTNIFLPVESYARPVSKFYDRFCGCENPYCSKTKAWKLEAVPPIGKTVFLLPRFLSGSDRDCFVKIGELEAQYNPQPRHKRNGIEPINIHKSFVR